jgi:hypothetical protein
MKMCIYVFCIAVLFVGSADAEPTVWYVHPDSALNSIQAGLDSCADNDIVLVGPGTYYENVIWPNTQGIHLISELGSDVTIIDGDSTYSMLGIIACTTQVDTTTTIRGFTICNGKTGITLSQASPTIINNLVTDNVNSNICDVHGGGIACWGASPIIANNAITDNAVDGFSADGGGIGCYENSNPFIISNYITGNTCYGGMGAGGGGICCFMTSAPTITGNVIVNNSVYSAVNCYGVV